MKEPKCRAMWQSALIPRACGHQRGAQGPACLLDTAASQMPWRGGWHAKDQSLSQASVVLSVAEEFGLASLTTASHSCVFSCGFSRGSCSLLLGC